MERNPASSRIILISRCEEYRYWDEGQPISIPMAALDHLNDFLSFWRRSLYGGFRIAHMCSFWDHI